MRGRFKPEDLVAGATVTFGLIASVWDWISPSAWIDNLLPNLTVGFLSTVIFGLWWLNYRVSRVFSQSFRDRLGHMLSGGNSAYHQLVSPHTRNIGQNLLRHIEDKTVSLYDTSGFPQLYIRAMETLPKESFCATAFADRVYFWSNDNVNDAMRAFLNGGGKLKRIFFLDYSKPPSPDQLSVLKEQHEMGVEVFTADFSQFHTSDQAPFLFNTRKTIGWTVERQSSKAPITKITVTGNSEALIEMEHRFDRILKTDGTRRFSPDRPIVGGLV